MGPPDAERFVSGHVVRLLDERRDPVVEGVGGVVIGERSLAGGLCEEPREVRVPTCRGGEACGQLGQRRVGRGGGCLGPPRRRRVFGGEVPNLVPELAGEGVAGGQVGLPGGVVEELGRYPGEPGEWSAGAVVVARFRLVGSMGGEALRAQLDRVQRWLYAA